MPRVRDFDEILKPFVNELCISVEIPKIELNFQSTTIITFPADVSAEEILFVLLTRVAHFIAVEICPNKFEEIKIKTMKLLGASYLVANSWDSNYSLKYFQELFKSKTWQHRDLTRNNADKSGKNHLVLLGSHKDPDWYSLKLNRYNKLSNYSLMIGYKDNIINIYKFGLKH